MQSLKPVMNPLRFIGRSFTSGELILVVALFVAATANAKFFSGAVVALGSGPTLWPFYGSLFATTVALLFLLLSALCHRWLVKPVLIVFLLLSAVLSYFAHAYGTVFDQQMIANTLQTDSAEARDLLTSGMAMWIAGLGILPALFVWQAKLTFPSWKAETIARLKLAGIALVVVALSGTLFGGHYFGLLREHRAVTSQAVPIYALVSAVKHGVRSLPKARREHIVVGEDAARTPGDHDRALVIMVVGETVRADHWGLNGYERDTTPELRRRNVVNFPDFWSCGTSTAISVPCMFSNLGRAGYSETAGDSRDNALDVLARAGVSVLWRDNNSSSKGVANRVRYEDFRTSKSNPICDEDECRDEGMLHGLQQWIDAQKGDMLIVLHQMGNHGPAYYKRYPKEFERFTPVCATSDLGSCTQEQVHNAYDNAILYTDHFLSKVIDLLKANENRLETAMFYLSDHGESLGEYGLYLHGAPYALAPEAQRHVPAVMWLGEDLQEDIVQSSVLERSRKRWTQDNVFATLLGFFEIRSKAYLAGMDILERVNEEREMHN